MTTETTARSLLVIDGHSWMHRAFHAISSPLTAPDGQLTNAVFGFFSMLAKTLTALEPDALVVAFDAGKPAFRTEALAQYKMQRPPSDPQLEGQFPLVTELLEAMDVPVVRLTGWEGDDILGTLSARAEEAGLRVYLATGDRDAWQLVSDDTSVVTNKVGSSDPVIITSDVVLERYGVRPDQVIDFLGLKGDTSDNIPGVPGIGEKTAAKLLVEYGSLDEVCAAARAGKISGRVGENLREHEQSAYVSRTVATIVRDVDIDLDLSDLRFGGFCGDEIAPVFLKYGLKSPLGWMKKFSCSGDDAGAAGKSAGQAYIDSGDESAAAGPESAAVSPLDDSAPSPYTGVVVDESGDTLFDHEQILTTSDGTAGGSREERAESVAHSVAELLQAGNLASPDLKALLAQVNPPDSSQPAALDDLAGLDTGSLFDLSLAAYLLASNRSGYDLSALALEHLGIDLADTRPEKRPLVAARLTARLAPLLEDALRHDGSLALYRDIELPLVPVLSAMERSGVKLDSAKFDELTAFGRAQREELRADIIALAGEDFNVDSPKQLAEILFGKLGLPVIKKTRTGSSTDASVLAELAAHHPIAAKVAQYREFTKLQNTYLEALPRLLAGDGRLHTTFNQSVAATGRLSSSNPNLQNIPVRTELGRRIREAFIPAHPDWSLLALDYSQIELRVLAELSEDPGLIEAFSSGEDFHASTAARVFGVSPDRVDAAMRSRAKAVNFGIVYGQGARALSLSLDVSYAEGKAMIDRYYEAFPRVKAYLDETVAFAHEHGWVATYFGRKRHIPELKSSNHAQRAFGERTAKNHPMQGTAADLIKLAMVAVARRMRQDRLQSRMLLQVHDELVFETPPAECEQLATLAAREMTQVVTFKVPLEVSTAQGPTWAEAK